MPCGDMGLESAFSLPVMPVKPRNSINPNSIPNSEQMAVLCSTSLGYNPGTTGKFRDVGAQKAQRAHDENGRHEKIGW